MKSNHSTLKASAPSARAFPGRGVWFSPAGRFDKQLTQAIDDGWSYESEVQSTVSTRLYEDHAKSIIARNQSPDVPFDQSINPYRGCEHGCVYCYARPSHNYLGLSPGLDFESKIYFKKHAARLLEKELEAPNYICSPINLGANTDPYQPAEKKLKITRQILQVLDRHNHPVTLITKGALVLRDLDILSSMAERNLVSVAVSVTTLENKLKRVLEPRTASGQARLKVIEALTAAHIPTTVLVAPVIPAINDHELEAIVSAAAQAGASQAHYIFLRLPFEVKDIFMEWLAEHFPMRAKHVMNLVGDARKDNSGEQKTNDNRFGLRMTGSGPYAEMIGNRFARVKNACGLQDRDYTSLNTDLFYAAHPAHAQLSLL